uniref:Uncharacterized protein n=1 Tax=Saccharolobus islandicus TaxID=43080 RepID=Q0ZNS7_SACIS|nr:hypothetical protein [Sulfolobus islandicus]ABE99639.1 hypothetical protein [Sulfolobus islandicus]
MDMEEFDISRILLIIIDIMINATIGIIRKSIVHDILYGISISQCVFYSSPVFSNSLAEQTLYNLDSISQSIYIFFGVIVPAFVIAVFIVKLSDFENYWNYFEENPSKAEKLLYFFIGLIVQLILH